MDACCAPTLSLEQRSLSKIAIISDSLYQTGGGVNQVVKDQLEVLSEALGVSVVLITRGGDFRPRSPNVTHRVLPPTDDIRELVCALEDALAGAALVLVHNIMTTPYSPALATALQSIIENSPGPSRRFVAWTHDVFQHRGRIQGLEYVAISGHRRELLARELGIEANQIRVVPNGVNQSSLLGLSAPVLAICDRLKLFACDYVAWYPVRLARNKNIERAVAIIAALNRKGNLTKLLAPGVTSDNAQWQLDYYWELRSVARRLGVEDKLVFLSELRSDTGGRLEVTDQIRNELYRVVSFMLFTSRDEGFGVPLLEAAACRLPIVASDIPAVREIVHESNVLVLDSSLEPDCAADAILSYLRSSSVASMHYRLRRHYDLRRLMCEYLRSAEICFERPRPAVALGAQSSVVYPVPLQGQLVDAVMNGFNVFEICFDGYFPSDVDEPCRCALSTAARDSDASLMVRAPLSDGLELGEWARQTRHSIEFADRIGAKTVTVVLPRESPDLIACLSTLVGRASDFGVVVVFENGSARDWPSGAQLSGFVGRFKTTYPALCNSVAVGFNLRRAAACGDLVGFAADIAELLMVIHIADDNALGFCRIGEGNLPLQEVLSTVIGRHLPAMTCVLEYLYPDMARDRALAQRFVDDSLKRDREVRRRSGEFRQGA